MHSTTVRSTELHKIEEKTSYIIGRLTNGGMVRRATRGIAGSITLVVYPHGEDGPSVRVVSHFDARGTPESRLVIQQMPKIEQAILLDLERVGLELAEYGLLGFDDVTLALHVHFLNSGIWSVAYNKMIIGKPRDCGPATMATSPA